MIYYPAHCNGFTVPSGHMHEKNLHKQLRQGRQDPGNKAGEAQSQAGGCKSQWYCTDVTIEKH